MLPLPLRVDLGAHSPKPQHYWSLTIGLFRVLSKTPVGRTLPLCRYAVGVSSQLSRERERERNRITYIYIYIYIYIYVCVRVCACACVCYPIHIYLFSIHILFIVYNLLVCTYISIRKQLFSFIFVFTQINKTLLMDREASYALLSSGSPHFWPCAIVS